MVEGQIKKLDTFQKSLSTLDSRVVALQNTAKQLTAARNMESSKIHQLIKEVTVKNSVICDTQWGNVICLIIYVISNLNF